jgi:hypothetical protein
MLAFSRERTTNKRERGEYTLAWIVWARHWVLLKGRRYSQRWWGFLSQDFWIQVLG